MPRPCSAAASVSTLLGVSALLAGGLALSGCPARPSSARAGPNGAVAECAVRLASPPTELPEPGSMPKLRSRLGVEVSAELGAVERALEREVPTGLAGERRRPVGTPGELSYSVTRGRFSSKRDGDRLVVAVPVAVEVEVCKPLGPFCPVYGSCSPRLAAVASVPLLLGDDYEIGRSRVGVSVTRGCTIAGIDATPEIRKRAASAVGVVQSRIDRSMPRVRPTVAGIWELLHHPVLLSTSTCLRIAPERLAQTHPKSNPDQLVTRLAAEGSLAIEDPCESPNAPVVPAPLPRLETRAELPDGVDLRVPIATNWSDVSRALERALEASQAGPDSPKLASLEASGAHIGGRDVVLLRGTLAGRVCGEAAWVAEPWFDPQSSRARLRKVVPASFEPNEPELARVAARIETTAAIPLPVDVSAGPAAIESLIRSFGEGQPQDVQVEASIAKAVVEDVRATREGLVAVATFTGTAAVRVR